MHPQFVSTVRIIVPVLIGPYGSFVVCEVPRGTVTITVSRRLGTPTYLGWQCGNSKVSTKQGGEVTIFKSKRFTS